MKGLNRYIKGNGTKNYSDISKIVPKRGLFWRLKLKRIVFFQLKLVMEEKQTENESGLNSKFCFKGVYFRNSNQKKENRLESVEEGENEQKINHDSF